MYECESWTIKAESWRMDASELCCWKRLLRVPWTARRSNQSIFRQSSLNVHWTDWCWNWSSNTLATWWEELTHWKRPWCWDRLKAGKEGDDRGWDGWMASPIQQMSLSKLQETVKDREAWRAAVHRLQSQTRLGDWTPTVLMPLRLLPFVVGGGKKEFFKDGIS